MSGVGRDEDWFELAGAAQWREVEVHLVHPSEEGADLDLEVRAGADLLSESRGTDGVEELLVGQDPGQELLIGVLPYSGESDYVLWVTCGSAEPDTDRDEEPDGWNDERARGCSTASAPSPWWASLLLLLSVATRRSPKSHREFEEIWAAP